MREVNRTRKYRSSRRKAQVEDTRTAILDAAIALFAEKGWVATTIAAIASKAGVSPETVYARFGNKKTIAHELVVRAMRADQPDTPMMQQARRAMVLQNTDGGDIIDGFAADISELLARVAPILAAVRAAAETDTEMAELYADLHQARRRNLGTLIDRLDRSGALRPGLDIELAKDTLWSVASPELWLLRLTQLGATPESNRDWIRTTLRRLLLP